MSTQWHVLTQLPLFTKWQIVYEMDHVDLMEWCAREIWALFLYIKSALMLVLDLRWSLQRMKTCCIFVAWHIALWMKSSKFSWWHFQRYFHDYFFTLHDDVIKWRHFPCYWSFVRGIHRSPVNCPHKGQWGGALMFSLICAWINGWVNNGDGGVWDTIAPIMTSL